MKSIRSIQTNKYPWIGISDINIIILFTSPKAGVILHQDNHKLGGVGEIGEYSSKICEEDFIPYTGTVTLSN